MKKTNKLLPIVLAMAVGFGLTVAVSATPPKKVCADYNPTSQTLKVIVVHKSGNPLRHHIKRVRVTRDKDEVADLRQGRQTSKSCDLVIFLMKDVNPGQTLNAKAYCNWLGSKSASVKVEEKAMEEARKDFQEQERELKLDGVFDRMYKQMMADNKTSLALELNQGK